MEFKILWQHVFLFSEPGNIEPQTAAPTRTLASVSEKITDPVAPH